MSTRLRTAGLTLLLTACVAVVAPAPASAATTTARSLLLSAPVAAEVNGGYDRALFGGWVDANGDCQSTRQEVLVAESRVTPTYTSSARCSVRTGRWLSAWDGATWTNPADVDIDHHVALGEAWGSGARSWAGTDRRRFANDLYGPALNAVTDNLNAAKGDRDPAQWLPPRTSTRCTYAITWVQVKHRWRLSMDSTERRVLSGILSGSCGARVVGIPARAR